MAKKCTLCNKRKAKRYCPAKRESICPVCCGEKRGVEINCPLDCQYYVEGQKHLQKKIMHQRIKKEGAGSYVRRAELYSRNPEIFYVIEKAIAQSYRENKNIQDRDLVSSLELIKKTLESEKKGLIYQHQNENQYANEVSSRLLYLIKEYQEQRGMGQGRLSNDSAIDVISEFLNEAKFYKENENHPQSYLIHLLRYHPAEETTTEHKSSQLIITP